MVPAIENTMRDPKPSDEDKKVKGSGRGRAKTFSQNDKEEITAKIDRVAELIEKSREAPQAKDLAPPQVVSKTPPAMIALQRRIGQVVIALGVGVVGYMIRDCEARLGINISQVIKPWPDEPPTKPEPWKRWDSGPPTGGMDH